MAKKDKDTGDRFIKEAQKQSKIAERTLKAVENMSDKMNKQAVRELKEFRGQTIKQKKDTADQKTRDAVFKKSITEKKRFRF